MRRLKAKAISTAMTFFWAVQAFGAEPKTEKIEVMLDIPANPFLDQVCVIANYLTIGAIICSIVFGGIWLMQKKDSSDDEDDDDNEEEVRAPVGSMAKVVNETPEIVKVEKPADETKAEEPKVEEPPVVETKVEEPKVEEPKAEEPPTEVTKTEETTAEELKPEEKAPAASKSKKAENDGTAKKPRKSKKKE
ncbi:hypothetical protein KA183_19285 [bacterium]|nr:hypothetical protein [bacterium]